MNSWMNLKIPGLLFVCFNIAFAAFAADTSPVPAIRRNAPPLQENDDFSVEPLPVGERAAPEPAEQPTTKLDHLFDQLIFGGIGADGMNVARSRMRLAMMRRIDELESVQSLTPVQREKLRLAGRGDIAHLFHRTEDLRTRFQRQFPSLVQADDLRLLDDETQRLWNEISSEEMNEGPLFRRYRKSITSVEPQFVTNRPKPAVVDPNSVPPQIIVLATMISVDRQAISEKQWDAWNHLLATSKSLRIGSQSNEHHISRQCLIVTDDVLSSPELKELQPTILSRPQIRCLSGFEASVGIGKQPQKPALLTMIEVAVLPKILAENQVELDLVVGIKSYSRAPITPSAIGKLRFCSSISTGEWLVVPAIEIPNTQMNAETDPEKQSDADKSSRTLILIIKLGGIIEQ